MKRNRRPLAVASLCLPALAVALTLALALGAGSAEAAPASQVPEPSLRVARCTEVEVGDTFTLYIWGNNVTKLLAFEVYFAYDPDVVRLDDKSVDEFLGSLSGSDVRDFSDPLPNDRGLYRMGASDLGSKAALEDGSGILVSLTITAVDEGISPASIDQIDFNDDGQGDTGPTITSFQTGRAVHMADARYDDGLFDGEIVSGQIAVGKPCVTPAPEPDKDKILDEDHSLGVPDDLEGGPPEEPDGDGGLVSSGGGPVSGGSDDDPGGSSDGDQNGNNSDPTNESDGRRSGGSSGPEDMPIWLIGLIVLVVTAAGLGLALSISILRSNRGL